MSLLNMFRTAKRVALLQEPLPEGPQKSTLVMSPMEPEFQNEYDTLAEDLGLACRAYSDLSLGRLLQELGVQVYNRSTVERYLDLKADTPGMRWYWFPLGGHDLNPTGAAWVIERETPTAFSSLYGVVRARIYELPVPYPVLLTVKKIKEACPEAVFFVAAVSKDPDPFLGVLSKKTSEFYIIERWDEPSFR